MVIEITWIPSMPCLKSGSIAKMVKSKKLTKGIMYECVKNNVPFVLAGSIRDDGPLPDVITDVAEAQRQYKKVPQRCGYGNYDFYYASLYCNWKYATS